MLPAVASVVALDETVRLKSNIIGFSDDQSSLGRGEIPRKVGDAPNLESRRQSGRHQHIMFGGRGIDRQNRLDGGREANREHGLRSYKTLY